MDQEDRTWLAAVRAGRPLGGFGHREHLRLAWLALEDAETLADACRDVATSVRAVATAHGAAHKYNETVTGAWVRIVQHVRTAYDVHSLEELLEVAPWLTDKRLLLRHYRSQTMASPTARHSYVAPDLRPIPA